MSPFYPSFIWNSSITQTLYMDIETQQLTQSNTEHTVISSQSKQASHEHYQTLIQLAIQSIFFNN